MDNIKGEKIKIAILLNTSWYIYNFRRNLIIRLLEKGYEVHSIAPEDVYSQKLIEIGSYFHDIDLDSKTKNPLSNLKQIGRIRKILREISPDILLNFTIKPNLYGTLAAAKLSIPVINNIAGLGTLYTESKISRFIFKKLFYYTQKKATHVFFQNPDDFNFMTDNNIVAKAKSSLLPGSGVDLIHFAYTPRKSRKSKNITFLLVARMIYTKGILEAVEACYMLKQKGIEGFELQLLGESGVNNPDAIPVEKLENLNKEEFISYLGKTDNVKPYIEQCDAMILPSYYREGTPKSLLEALAVGRPIITTDNPGCRETVSDNINGLICRPQSVESLCEKMEDFLKLDEKARMEMGRASRIIAEEKYDEEIVLRAYVEAIKAAVPRTT